MVKITFVGAGSTIFAKNLLGDCLLLPALQNSEIALYDIDESRLKESQLLIETCNNNLAQGKATITTYCGEQQRIDALREADFVINAIQVGGYKPSTVIDFEIPQKFGLQQTIADTLGIGGIFRGLRTIPVMLDIAREMEEVCPHALMLNYTNPMCMVTGAMLRASAIATVGLCHSVQVCVPELLNRLGIQDIEASDIRWKIGGINHMAWLLEAVHIPTNEDLYPRFRILAQQKNEEAFTNPEKRHDDMVRFALMQHLGYYITESSEHNAEYSNFWIKQKYPTLIEKFNIPLNEYIRRCEQQIQDWESQRDKLLQDSNITHTMSKEYGAHIMNAAVTNEPYFFHGNVLNHGEIPNLPLSSCIEVPCAVDSNGVQPCYFGALPPQCAAMNMTNINVQELTIQAALSLKKEYVYHAAMLDPHTSSELSIDDIIQLCDELIEAHGTMLPKFKGAP